MFARGNMRGPAVALAALLVLTACGGGEPEAQPEVVIDGESSAPAGGGAGSSDLPDGVPTEPPSRPESERSEAGAKVFAQYVGDLWWYTANALDPEPLRALSPPGDRCEWCADSIRSAVEVREQALADGLARVPSADPSYRYGRASALPGTPSLWTVNFELKAPSVDVVDRDSGEVRERLDAYPWTPFWVDIEWKDGRWELLQFRFDADA